MASTAKIRVLVADDFPTLRRGVVTVIAADAGMQVVAEAGSADEVLAGVAREAPDALVLDLGMPGVRGLDLVKELRARHPSLGILVFSMHREDEVGLSALKAGASGFLNKGAPPEELRLAVHTVAAGRRYLSPALTEALVESAQVREQEPPHLSLSERELDVLCRIGRGQKMGDIANELGISAKTVHTYRTRILQKLDVRSNVELVLYAVQHHLLGWPPHDPPLARERIGDAADE
jgi:DNA-binding NarL/FixJ family response regulator